jgi:hypothetical protein
MASEPPAGRALDEPVRPVRPGGSRGPIIAGGAVAAVLAVLLWHPWGAPGTSTPTAWTAPSSPATAVRTPSAPSPSIALQASPPFTGTATYRSLTDNEWSVVAMLATGAGPSTEEPAGQHPSTAASPDQGTFQVLQQPAAPTTARVVPDAASLCDPTIPARDRPAVLLPAGRVAYLGVTYPGMDPRASVTAAGIRRAAPAFDRVPTLAVAIAGLEVGTRYAIPSSGPGATDLFATVPPQILSPGAYRFEVREPGAGTRYVYACIGA